MAVYTKITEGELCSLLELYGLSGLAACEGASEGIENTTYFVTLNNGSKYVLTIFEGADKSSLPFYAKLTRVLSEAGLPVPAPIVDRHGQMLQRLHEKPALLFPRAKGSHRTRASIVDCAAIGAMLARIHLTLLEQKTDLKAPNPRGLDWFESVMKDLSERVDEASRALFTRLLSVRSRLDAMTLPVGLIHGDLFLDNTLFFEGRLSAVIDFYNAGEDILLLDLAIVANDWCCDALGELDRQKVSALKAAYATERNLSAQENQAWAMLLAWAAGRFWLSRLKSQLDNEAHQKDPGQYRKILERRLQACL
ncbi:MAG: homoserine kinase [Pseudomonadales bacterium]|nr:homoserine kinase [Pseudomonadales bacterium]